MKLRILFPVDMSTTYPRNPYLSQLMQALLDDPGVGLVAHGPIHLLHGTCDWDVVHIQWPEALLGWKDERRVGVEEIDAALDRLARRALIVHTVHNNDAKQDLGEVGIRLFASVFRHTDVFLHLGKRSREWFCREHAKAPWATRARHVVIPHGNYDFYKDFKEPEKGIPVSSKRKRLLVFGELRTVEEEALAREAFVLADVPRSQLVFAGPLSRSGFPASVRAGLEKADTVVRLHKRIQDRSVAPLFESCRAVFIPRAGRLNSGVVPLAFTFGLPVVAPDEGVIGEMSGRFGGMVYTPGDRVSAAAAIRKALSISPQRRARLRRRILDYSARVLAWPRIAAQHRKLYLKNIRSTRRLPLLKRLTAWLLSWRTGERRQKEEKPHKWRTHPKPSRRGSTEKP
ncbi:hypothetical protein [Mycoplana dimorpha]|uniref:Glycosyltransferase involved in cell wall biosynthesis n=1 Tax=Mycoplana dimorpha TaxID=28320 RepID=A0A2T5BF01_MYCDI|nr:hypothetical protein [Mycoplana dimorpha]PTM97571.1 glycosyltransferase involved in cell wall biosynthesis [Mycoplana dimorpha]